MGDLALAAASHLFAAVKGFIQAGLLELKSDVTGVLTRSG